MMDPKERKAILIFFALLLLILTYVYTHELPWETRLPGTFEPDAVKQAPSEEYSTERYF